MWAKGCKNGTASLSSTTPDAVVTSLVQQSRHSDPVCFHASEAALLRVVKPLTNSGQLSLQSQSPPSMGWEGGIGKGGADSPSPPITWVVLTP